MRQLHTLFAALLLGVLAGCAPNGVRGGADRAAGASGAEILWDRYGVPHISAPDDSSLIRAFGWAQARNHGDLLLALYGQSRGRAAEYWGATNLDDDRWYLAMRVRERARATYDAQTPAMRRIVDAFADGINAYARAHRDAIVDSVEVVLPVTGEDVLANAIAFGLFFSPARSTARRWSEPAGSNAWAVAPSKSVTGHAMLLANPHLPWSGNTTWFEAQLTAPGLDAYGAAILGAPLLGIAFNDRLGWTYTVNTQDGEDLYELTLADGGYLLDGRVRPFETDTVRIRVRQSGGAVLDEALVRRRSVHGPIVSEKGGKAIAVRLASERATGGLAQLWGMLRARTRADFERALAQHQNSGFNLIYADADGDILYSYGALTPRRSRDSYAFWTGIVPGDSSALLWDDVHGYAEMPRLLNPPSGWIQNANDGPWYTTLPPRLSPDSFPAYFAPRPGLAFRPQQSIQLLSRAGKLSLDSMIRLKHSTEMELAVRIVPELVEAARARGSAEARAAADVLERWDRTADAGSRGGVLFQTWHAEAVRRASGARLFARPWSAEDPIETPDGLADPSIAVAALEAAAAEVRRRWGALDVPWGDVHRLRRDGVDLPANGGPSGLGVFRNVVYDDASDGKRVPVHGDSYVAAIEFSSPVRAFALIGYGNASQPGSPHRTDQLELFAQKRLRAVWRTRADIEANLRDRERP